MCPAQCTRWRSVRLSWRIRNIAFRIARPRGRIILDVKMKTRLYNIWCGMKCRCYNANHHTYSRYGARGILVCNEWKTSFGAFRNWAETHGYNDTLTIDRINPDGPYSPNNCRWVSWTEQSLSKTLKYRGIPISVLARNAGVPYGFYYERLKKGIPLEKPKRVNLTLFTARGETHSLREWSRILKMNSGALWYKINKEGPGVIERLLADFGC